MRGAGLLCGLAEERLRFGQLALGPQQSGQAIHRDQGVRVLGSQRLLKDRQGALVEWPGCGEVALVLEQ